MTRNTRVRGRTKTLTPGGEPWLRKARRPLVVEEKCGLQGLMFVDTAAAKEMEELSGNAFTLYVVMAVLESLLTVLPLAKK